ncbi:MAG: DUF86 domain-containing protein [Candidatus Polarisedimenticolaceae bacterium]|nr:DUF86 domain-containing protein [Candidatus Polarisedimenticolaceae bacterium]
MNPSDNLRLADNLRPILQAIHRIQEYTSDMDGIAFLQDQQTQDAVIRNFEVIGEASNNINKRHPDFVDQHPVIPLVIADEMRNALAHGYFKVDIPIVWRTIELDLPQLEEQVSRLQTSLA